MAQNFQILAKITAEPPQLPSIEHATAHILNAPLFERKYARAYLGNKDSREAVALRRQIAKGAREALEAQYWNVLTRTLDAKRAEARLGGDPSVANQVRAFLFLRYYRNGEWQDRIEVSATVTRFYVAEPRIPARGRTTALGQTVLSGSHRSC